MSSKRTTRAGTRRLSRGAATPAASSAGNDGSKSGGGRQLSIPQMLLRHTEQLSISENPDASSSSRRSSLAKTSARVPTTVEEHSEETGGGEDYDDSTSNSNNKNNNNDLSARNRNANAIDPASTDGREASTSSATTEMATRGGNRRKRRASDSVPETEDNFAGAKRRQTLAAGTGWIPLSAKPEIAWYGS